MEDYEIILQEIMNRLGCEGIGAVWGMGCAHEYFFLDKKWYISIGYREKDAHVILYVDGDKADIFDISKIGVFGDIIKTIKSHILEDDTLNEIINSTCVKPRGVLTRIFDYLGI